MVAVATTFARLLQSPTALAGLAAGLAVVILGYRLFFAPLSKIPGPWITAITSLWVMYHEFRGDRTVTLDQLHAKYGPVVRVSPTEASFNDGDALKEIYGIKSSYSKSHFYDMFVYYNERNTFTSLNRADHTTKKRLVADRYAKTYVMQDSVAQKIQGHASRFMSQVRAAPASFDVYTWLHYYALDCITNHLFGTRGTDTLTTPEHRGLVYDLAGVKHRTRLYMIFYFGPLMTLREWLRVAWRKLSGGSTVFHVRGSRLNDYGKDSVVGFRADQLDKDTVSTCSKLLKAVPDNENQVAAECMDHLVAGVDTTGDAMCVTMWRISTSEYTHVQDRLYEELKTIEHTYDAATETYPIGELEKLPYLEAVLYEGLRWRPPVPMTLFRIVPSGGTTISGYHIPAGITVGCQAYSLHRREDVFPSPDLFDPERWLTKDPQQLAAMKAHFWPFSSGGRMCLGHNIAMVEMKILMGAVYGQWKTRAVAECTEESMRMDDQLTSGVPYSLSCNLSFEYR
ncbi:hypothetical protein LTS15_003365 [Exophiala xenobiotica]|nr:hypothetical protein LTS15_003365 [Exophiala xenobiotica]